MTLNVRPFEKRGPNSSSLTTSPVHSAVRVKREKQPINSAAGTSIEVEIGKSHLMHAW